MESTLRRQFKAVVAGTFFRVTGISKEAAASPTDESSPVSADPSPVVASEPDVEVPTRPAAETIVTMTQLVLPSDVSKDGGLLAGPLLKWIDICACMSAERFSGTHCVTASMEDIHFLKKVSVGEAVKLTARVHQAWKTSMEVGVTVTIDRLGESDTEPQVCCHAMSTFVSKDKKVLPKLEFSSDEEKAWAEQANSRKAIRLKMPKKQGQEGRPEVAEGTTVSTELVMPHHCQHMGTTFGGWIMQWMECAASIAAVRHTRMPMVCVSTDTLNFLAPSHPGDAVELRAKVTCVWNSSMEIGCWASAENLLEGTSKPICQMYATYASSGEAKVLPPLLDADGAVEKSEEAYHRRAARLQRKALQDSGELSVDAAVFDDRAARSAVRNLQELTREGSGGSEANWETVFDGRKHGISVVVDAIEGFPTTCVRMRFHLGTPAARAHAAVNDFEDRKSWDLVFKEAEPLTRPTMRRGSGSSFNPPARVAEHVDVDLVRLILASGHDAVVARARMEAQEEGKPIYISASRSVRHPDAPAETRRIEVLPSGWVFRDDGTGGCKAAYTLQLGAIGLGLILSSKDGQMLQSVDLTANLLQAKESMPEASGGMLFAAIGSIMALMKKFPDPAQG